MHRGAAVAPSVDVAEAQRVHRRPQSVNAYEMAIRARALILPAMAGIPTERKSRRDCSSRDPHCASIPTA